jgi:hypothetical protein
MHRPPRLFNVRPPRPQNTYIWARWSELHRVVRALAKVCTTFNWLIADAPPKSIHAIAVYLRSESCRKQWPVTEEFACDATPPVTDTSDTNSRLISLAQHLCETDHADLLSRALPDCPATMFPILDRCGETVQTPEFYVALFPRDQGRLAPLPSSTAALPSTTTCCAPLSVSDHSIRCCMHRR